MSNALNWFEIPAADIKRAVKFYSTVLGVELEISDPMPGFQMAMFPADAEGSVVYLNAGEDLAVALAKVEGAGGQVLVPKTGIGENGFFAFFLDTEGNKVGLHSTN
jgi:predicted enzyme related to lactoylglutathione lyase